VPGPGQYSIGKRSDISQTSQPKNRVKLRGLKEGLERRPITNQQQRSRCKSHEGSVVFDTKEKRFREKGLATYFHQHGTSKQVGPGSYCKHSSFVKQSFNMSVEQPQLPMRH
jgi:hypothetical protein